MGLVVLIASAVLAWIGLALLWHEVVNWKIRRGR